MYINGTVDSTHSCSVCFIYFAVHLFNNILVNMRRKKLGNPTTIILKYLFLLGDKWFRLFLQDLYCPRSEPSCVVVCGLARCATAAASTRWGHISPAGGALLPGCNPARLPTRSLRSALDFLVRDYGHFLLQFGRGTTRSDVIRAKLSS